MSFIKYVEPQVDFGESPAVDMFSRSWSKLASSTYMPAAVEEFLKTAKPVPGHRLLLVHGLGSSEYYGANNNGDAFPEMWKGAKNLIEDDVAKGYGFKTFEKNAHTFRDHRNHDPKLTIGGKVVLAAWNDRMHRVELILPVSEKLAPDVVDAIDKGEKLAVSMGARVPYDVCSICQNKAKHRGQYCKHAMFHMNEVMDDGRKVYVDNPQPNFFDISVLGHRGKGRPADPSAYSIMKVASTLSVRPGFSVKGAEEKKSEIEKKVPAVAEDAEDVLSGSSDKSHSIMDLVRKLLPFDLGTMDGPSSKCIIVIKRMIAGRPEKKEAALATFSSAGFILRPQDLAALGMTGREKLAFDKFSASMFDVIASEMPAGSLWLPYFGDRVYRNHKLGSAPKADLPADVDYRAYVSTLKTAFTNADTLRTLAGVVEKNYALKSAIANGDLADLQKFAAKGTGLSAENLVAALLAPMLAGAYFRSQQYSGEPVGPVRGFIANHPLATGIAGSLLWHKLKGGKIPLVQQ